MMCWVMGNAARNKDEYQLIWLWPFSFLVSALFQDYLQRQSSPCPFDRLLATRYGAHAVELIAQKKFGEMVSYQPPIITSVPLEKEISSLKLVEPDCELVKIAEGMGVCFGR